MKSNIKDYPNYNVSKSGIITNIKTNKTIKNLIDKNGYFRVNLYNKTQHIKPFVHRLVAMAYLVNTNNLPQVNHKDGNKRNNNVENLEWCSAKENVIHSYRLGLKHGKGVCHIGELNTKSKLTENDVKDIRKKKSENKKIRDVYNNYRQIISYKGFEQVWFGYRWKHLVEKAEE